MVNGREQATIAQDRLDHGLGRRGLVAKFAGFGFRPVEEACAR